MTYRTLVVQQDGPVVRVTLHRPEARNAFDETMIAELTAWAEGLATRPGVRAAVLSGAGSTFSAGADLGWLSRSLAQSPEEDRRAAERMAAMFEALDRIAVPLLGRIHGAALGGGAGLVAVCDIAIAEATARFGFPEVRLGLIPAVIAPYVMAKIGLAAARHLFLTGERFAAERALALGLVQVVAPPGALDAELARVLAEVLAAGPEAAAAAKALLRTLPDTPRAAAAAVTAAAIAARRTSAEGQEGMRAFLERRKPRWVEAG